MAKKQQITITIDGEIVDKLRKLAERRKASLSSVIETYLRSADAFSSKTDIQRVLEIVKEIKDQIRPDSAEDPEAG